MIDFKAELRLISYKKEWRKKNSHNHTYPYKEMPFDRIHIGKQTYGCIHAEFYNKEEEMLTIGHFCSIAPETVFICGGNHNMSTISSFPFGYYFEGNYVSKSNGEIRVLDDVWLGYGATVLSGVTIGQGAVVAARSVVTSNVPPYAIVAGNPAKILKYRFSDEIIEELLKCDFSAIDETVYMQYKDCFETNMSSKEKCVEVLNKIGIYKR